MTDVSFQGTAGSFTFVTVAFKDEEAMLELQARSFECYVRAELVQSIIVIDNSPHDQGALNRAVLTASYGRHAKKVAVYSAAEIAAVPSTSGWISQQILKLLVAERVQSSQYVVLDAKNHFVRPLAFSYFVSNDGRSRLAAYSFVHHPLRPRLETVLRYLNVEPEADLRHFTATVTPFVFNAVAVRGLLKEVAQESGRTFAEEFVAAGLSEFFLYGAWLIRKYGGFERLHTLDLIRPPNVWPRPSNRAGVRDALRLFAATHSPMFSVHRRVIGSLDKQSRADLTNFWLNRRLFESKADVDRFIEVYVRQSDVGRPSRTRLALRRARAVLRHVKVGGLG